MMRSASIGANLSTKIGGNQTITVGAADTSNATGNVLENIGGNHGEVVGGAKSETEAAAAVHLVQGTYTTEAGAALAYTVGGIHLRKVVADYALTAPTITLMDAMGLLKAGSSKIALSGGPMTLKASKISIKAPMIRRVGGTIKSV